MQEVNFARCGHYVSVENMYCIDSDFAIDYIKGKKPTDDVMKQLYAAGDVFITTPSVFELTYVTKGFSDKRERAILEFLSSLTVLDFELDAALDASRIGRDLAHKGEMIHPMDLFIGATVLHYNLTLMTRNIQHFERIEGLRVETW